MTTDEKIDLVLVRLGALEAQFKSLDDSINRTEDPTKPSLKMQIQILVWEIAQLKEFKAKFWAVAAAPSITVLIGYGLLQLFGTHTK